MTACLLSEITQPRLASEPDETKRLGVALELVASHLDQKLKDDELESILGLIFGD